MTTRRIFIKQAPAAALAVAIPVTVANAAEPDPIFAIIEANKRLGAAFMAARGDDEVDDRYAEYEASCITMFTTKPTTIEGVAAVIEYANEPEYGGVEQNSTLINTSYENSDGELKDASLNFLTLMAKTLRELRA